MHTSPSALPTAAPYWRIGIVHAEYYPELMEQMVQSAVDALQEAGIPESNISLHPVPGSFEIPLIGSHLAKNKSVDALIGLGIIVQGETDHAELIARESARGMMDVQLQFGIPFAYEVLSVESLELAKKRLQKGRDAAVAALNSLQSLEQ